MTIRRRAIVWSVWSVLSVVWAGVVLLGGRAFVDAELGHRYQYVQSVRADAPPWELGLSPPFYEVFRSPAAEQLPVLFNWFGYMGVDDWNLFAEKRNWVPSEFPDGDVLYLNAALSDADKAYVKAQFASQSGARRAEWLDHFRPWIAMALGPPALALLLILLVGVLRRTFAAPATTAAPPNS